MHIICITNTRVNMVCVHSYICANYVRARCGFLSIQLAHRIDIYTAYIQLHTVNGNQYVKVFRLSNSRCKKIKIFPFWRPRMRRSNIFKCFMQKCLWKNCRVISFIAFLLYSTVDYFRTEEKSFSIKDTVQHWPMGRISLLCQTVN